jgi:hypothetical protein
MGGNDTADPSVYIWEQMPGFGEQLGDELARSERFRETVERRRAVDERQRRGTARFDAFRTVEAMEAEVDRRRNEEQAERKHRWQSATQRLRAGPAPNEPADHLQRHARGLMSEARRFLGATTAANAYLQYVRSDGESPIPIPGSIASLPAATGPVGSSMFARFNGDERWAARTADNAFTRHVARAEPEAFSFYFHKQT